MAVWWLHSFVRRLMSAMRAAQENKLYTHLRHYSSPTSRPTHFNPQCNERLSLLIPVYLRWCWIIVVMVMLVLERRWLTEALSRWRRSTSLHAVGLIDLISVGIQHDFPSRGVPQYLFPSCENSASTPAGIPWNTYIHTYIHKEHIAHIILTVRVSMHCGRWTKNLQLSSESCEWQSRLS